MTTSKVIENLLQLEYDFSTLQSEIIRGVITDYDKKYQEIVIFYKKQAEIRRNENSKKRFIQLELEHLGQLLKYIKITTNGMTHEQSLEFQLIIEDLIGELDSYLNESTSITTRPKIKFNGEYSALLIAFEKFIESKTIDAVPYRIAQLIADNFVQKHGKEIKEETVNSMFTNGFSIQQEEKLKSIINQ